jgi:hypothetical protein
LDVRAQPVDPRDTGWEIDHPAYRVCFWQQRDSGVDASWASEEWQVDDADIHDVLAWADADTSRRAYTLYVCSTCDGTPGLIRLYGRDPTAPD